MPDASPFDLIRKASRTNASSDRWAALASSASERHPVTQAPAAEAQQDAPQIPQVPFAPPQARHPHLDEIAQRHLQAVRNAMPPQEWTMRPAQPRPEPPPAQPDAAKSDPLVGPQGTD